jgi:hypothetical protein
MLDRHQESTFGYLQALMGTARCEQAYLYDLGNLDFGWKMTAD